MVVVGTVQCISSARANSSSSVCFFLELRWHLRRRFLQHLGELLTHVLKFRRSRRHPRELHCQASRDFLDFDNITQPSSSSVLTSSHAFPVTTALLLVLRRNVKLSRQTRLSCNNTPLRVVANILDLFTTEKLDGVNALTQHQHSEWSSSDAPHWRADARRARARRRTARARKRAEGRGRAQPNQAGQIYVNLHKSLNHQGSQASECARPC